MSSPSTSSTPIIEPPEDQPISSTSSRGQRRTAINANHLLNFQRPSAPPARDNAGGPSRRHQDNSTVSQSSFRHRRSSTRLQKYDRTKFLQANFRFIVSDSIERKRYETDPDLIFDWEDVAALDVITTHPLTCPISIDFPLSPCITPCGHIFSEEAIMAHFITQGGPDLRVSSSCPVCNWSISSRELRIIRIHQTNPVRLGDKVTFKLLKRKRDSIIVHPARCENENRQNSKEKDLTDLFSKFRTIDNPFPLWSDRVSILARKAAQFLSEGGADVQYEVPPILAAIDGLALRAKSWTERRQRLLLESQNETRSYATSNSTGDEALHLSPEIMSNEVQNALKKVAEHVALEEERKYARAEMSAQLDQEFPALSLSNNTNDKTHGSIATISKLPSQTGAVVEEDGALDNTTVDSSAPTALDDSPSTSSEMYFYQAADGQLIFLCPLNMKMLVSWTSSYASLPNELTVPIIEMEEIEQSEANRKRLKALHHIPLGGLFTLCEVDLTSILPPEAIAPFEVELAQKEKKRAQIARNEAKRLLREQAKMAASASVTSGPSAAELAAMPRLQQYQQRPPSTTPVDVPVSMTASEQQTQSEEYEDEEEMTMLSPSPTPGISFAKIAKLGFAATGPALGESIGNGSSPPSSAWGSSPPLHHHHHHRSRPSSSTTAWGRPSTSSSHTPTPPSTMQSTTEGTRADDNNTTSKDGSSKRKGKQKVLLLSTSQRRY